MAVTFNTLNPDAPIFKELSTNAPVWWRRFVNDPALYIEVRKDNQINVYFEGGSIARIHYCRKKKILQVFTHHKYLGHPNSPTSSSYEECSTYIGQIVEEVIERVKIEYSQKNTEGGSLAKEKWSEKYIQGNLVVKNRDCHLDSEFAYIDQETNNRIDLVRCDQGVVTFIELKRMDDGRMLHEDDESPEIVEQMNRYRDFILKYGQEILSYYQKLYDIKKSLQLPVPKVRPSSVSQDPQLIIFDRWVKSHPKRDVHRRRMKQILEREGISYSIISDL